MVFCITIKLIDERKLVNCTLHLQKSITILYCLSGAIIKWEQWRSHVASYCVHIVIKDYKNLWCGVWVCSNIIMFTLNFTNISKSVEKGKTNITQSAQ